jgi:branched-subunit amino acid aminotransferase/4-amino-4-deoxychorismate lyase
MNETQIFGPGILEMVPANDPGLTPRTSLPIHRGRPVRLDAHLARLMAGAAAMGTPAEWTESLADAICDWIGGSMPYQDSALRLVLHPGFRLLMACLGPLPTTPEPYRLAVLPHPLGERRSDPLLVHKGVSGPWWESILEQSRGLGADDAVLVWPDGSLAETAIASLGVEVDDKLWVPLAEGRVAGIAERLDLPVWAEARGLEIRTGPIHLERLAGGRLWCMNALRGIWPATLL